MISNRPVPNHLVVSSLRPNLGRYRPEIDGLRAFAVFAVILNHFNKAVLPSGYLGVDVFFVISGYVITSSLYGRESRGFWDFVVGFYERRVKRLVPALSVFVLCTALLICLFNPAPGLSLRTGASSLFGLSNLYLLKQSTDYFAQSTELNVFTHTWSLGVEEQFYLLFPFLIWFSGFGKQSKNGARNFFLVVAILSISSYIFYLHSYRNFQPAAYFLMPSRFWEMAAGCLVFIGFQKRASVEQWLEKVPPLLVVAGMVAVMFLPLSYATTSTTAIVLLSSVLLACLKEKTAAFELFTFQKIVYLGKISYSLYLWHWGVLSLSRWTIGIHWWSAPFQLLLILGLATASFQWVETPFRNASLFGRRWQALLAGGGVLFASSVALFALDRFSPLFFTGSRTQNYPLNPPVKSVLDQAIYPCYESDKPLEKIINECYRSSVLSDRQTIWLLGDSHARSIGSSIAALSQKYSSNLFSFTYPRTAFPAIPHLMLLIPRDQQDTLKSSEMMTRLDAYLLDRAKPGDIVFIVMRYPYHFGDSEYDFPLRSFRFPTASGVLEQRNSKNHSFSVWLNKLQVFADSASRKGIKIVLMTPTPEFPQNNYGLCVKKEWFNLASDDSCAVESSLYKGINSSYSQLNRQLSVLASAHSNVFIYDAFASMCDGAVCHYRDGRWPLYDDASHISLYGAINRILPRLEHFLLSKGLLKP